MPAEKKAILVVDDDTTILGLMKHRFERAGYHVITSESGAEAIEAIQSVGEKGNVPLLAVFLDLRLVDMHGFDVLKSIKKLQPSLPVIMVTGIHDEYEARQAVEFGALDYVTKPIDFNYLINILSLQHQEGEIDEVAEP